MNIAKFLRRTRILGLLHLAFFLGLQSAQAGSATWKLNPTTGDWNTASNWTPATVPNAQSDIATFGLSNTTTVSTSEFIELDSVVLTENATAYLLTFSLGADIYGAGLVNNSRVTQNVTLPENPDPNGGTCFCFVTAQAPEI